MSLRWRIALALAAVAAATTISVGIVSYRATSIRLLGEVDNSLDQAWETIAADPGSAARTRGLLDVFVIQLIGPDGTFLRGSAVTPIGPGPSVDEAVADKGVHYYDTVGTPDGPVRVLTIGVRGGAIQVARQLDEYEGVLSDLGRRTVWLVALVTVVAAALGWLIARSVTGPLVRLTRAATDVERSGRLDVAVPVAGRDEVGRLGTAFNGMLGALAASRDDQRRLVEDAGHELRTPLTSVRTNLAVLRRHPDLDPETRGKVLDDLYAETEELVVLVEEVVESARGTIDDAPPERIELGPLAAAQALRGERRHGRPVSVTADDSVVVAPPAALERAISNLIDNAAKFDPSGGPIDIEVTEGAVTVLDRGPGIAAADRDRVFDRFYRADGARSLPGSGLGLSIVREVAERSGGTVEVADRPAGGAAVSIRLPHVSAPPDQ